MFYEFLLAVAILFGYWAYKNHSLSDKILIYVMAIGISFICILTGAYEPSSIEYTSEGWQSYIDENINIIRVVVAFVFFAFYSFQFSLTAFELLKRGVNL